MGDTGDFKSLGLKGKNLGSLGGSDGEVSDFSSGQDLIVCEFEPHNSLCADSSELGACFGFCVSSPLTEE